MKVGSLFAGIGGFDLGLERAGFEIAWQVEIDPYCQRVLAKHWPNVTRYGDIKAIDWGTVEPVDLVCGGFPCQPVSVAGKGLCASDERWLWPEFERCLGEVQPTWVLIENVRGLQHRGLNVVRDGLAGLGYRSRPLAVTACMFGAPHARARLFIVAHHYRLNGPEGMGHYKRETAVSSRYREPGEGSPWVLPFTGVRGVASGVPSRMDRVRAVGNSVVPQIAEWLGRQIMSSERA